MKKKDFFSFKEIISLFKITFQEFFKENTFIHSAAISYYTVLTLVPILYISIQTFGQVIGQKTMVAIISKFLTKNVGISDVNGIIDFLNEIDFEKGNSSFMSFIIIVVMIFSSSALLNVLKHSVNHYLGVELTQNTRKEKIIANLVSRIRSILILAFFGLILIFTYFSQTILISFSNQIFSNYTSFQSAFGIFAQHSISLLSNVLFFIIVFKFLSDATLTWKTVVIGSLFTSILLYLSQLLIKFYIENYFFARDGGIAGTILIILVWMFYSSQIIFLGAKFTAVYSRIVKFRLNLD